MHRARKTTLTPSQRRRLESQRKEPIYWSEWLAIMAVLLSVFGGSIWLGIRVFTWATTSPTAQIVMR